MSPLSATTDPALAERAFQRILLIKPSSLGDVVHGLPVLHTLRRRCPTARIDWLVNASCAGLLAEHPEIDERVVFDRQRFGGLGRSWEATTGFLHFLRELRRRRYDLVVDLQGLFRSGFLARATSAPVRLGFAEAREGAWWFYTHRVTPPPEAVHAVDRNLAVVKVLGVEVAEPRFDLALTEVERRNGAALLAAAGLEPGSAFVAVLPGGRWETKRWYPSRFAAVLDRLAGEVGIPPVLLGGTEDRETCAAIERGCQRRPVNLAGRTGLRELVAVLEQAAVVLCHDSAPMHVAAALGRPLVCLLGPTHRRRTGPYGTPATILQADLACVPCYLRKLSQCRFEHRCMTELEVEQVYGALRAVLEPVGKAIDK